MAAKFDVQIPFGRYYVKEISTDEHYVLNGEKYLVNLNIWDRIFRMWILTADSL